ncbi:hypothetical protein [Yersinia enterocolitica]
MPDINFNPFKTRGAFSGLFNVESQGLTQGDAQDDPAIRMQLCSGLLDSNITDPVWGGVGMLECIAPSKNSVCGSILKKATATECNAFTVFNQAFHGITTHENPVPLYLAGGSVHYYRIGSGARIPLPISAAVAALADGTNAVGADDLVWDMTNNVVDVSTGSGGGNPKVNIKLLMVSVGGNLTVKKEDNGNVVWEYSKPCGLFLI